MKTQYLDKQGCGQCFPASRDPFLSSLSKVVLSRWLGCSTSATGQERCIIFYTGRRMACLYSVKYELYIM